MTNLLIALYFCANCYFTGRMREQDLDDDEPTTAHWAVAMLVAGTFVWAYALILDEIERRRNRKSEAWKDLPKSD